MAEPENVFCDDPSTWSEECVMECLSLGSGSQSSVEHSPGYWEKQMEANRAAVRASLLTDFDRETFVSLAQHVAGDSVKELPPFRIVRYPDLMEQAWGWERLVPYDGGVDMPTYVAYLQLYYRKNSLEYVVTGDHKPEEWPLKNDGARGKIALGNGLAAVANICLKAERELVSEWNKRAESRVNVVTVALSNLIQDWAHSIIRAGEFSDARAAALVCLIKEAYLICELLRRGANLNDCFIKQSSEIRMCALGLMNCKEQQSDATAALMVGMAQETKMMCAWMKEEDTLLDSHSVDVPDEISDCEMIRFRTLNFMASKLQETSLSSFASETDHGGNVTATAAPEAAKSSGCHTVERMNHQDQKKIRDSVRTEKRKKSKKPNDQGLKSHQKKRNMKHKRKSGEIEDREKKAKGHAVIDSHDEHEEPATPSDGTHSRSTNLTDNVQYLDLDPVQKIVAESVQLHQKHEDEFKQMTKKLVTWIGDFEAVRERQKEESDQVINKLKDVANAEIARIEAVRQETTKMQKMIESGEVSKKNMKVVCSTILDLCSNSKDEGASRAVSEACQVAPPPKKRRRKHQGAKYE